MTQEKIRVVEDMKRHAAALAGAVAAVVLAAPGRAQHVASVADKLKLSEVIESLTLAGDLRLRHDTMIRKTAGSNDRSRLRYRLRYGAETKMPHDLTIGLRLASGTGEQTSTNQSYDNLGSQKGIFIDQVFARWAPALPDPRGAVSLAAGRMPNNLWRVYSSDLIWDEDFNPEGMGESARWEFPQQGAVLFVNGLQMMVDEDSNSSRNQWLFSQQFGAELPLPAQNKLTLAAAYHKWTDENRNSFGQAAGGSIAQDGNRKLADGTLTNRFGVGELTGQVAVRAWEFPVTFQGTIARNLRSRSDLDPRARDGYQYGVILGSAKTEGGLELAAFHKYAQADVSVADVADSDFGEGGSNRRGAIFWASYSPKSWMNVRAKYFTTKVIDRGMNTATLDTNRLQLDWSVKF